MPWKKVPKGQMNYATTVTSTVLCREHLTIGYIGREPACDSLRHDPEMSGAGECLAWRFTITD